MVNSLPMLEEFTGLALGSWGDLDIAQLNLMSARELPGTENADIEEMRGCLDDWAERVRFEIRRHLYRFDPRTLESQSEFSYGNSLGRFCCWYLLQVLQEDCGVAYHPDRKFKPDFCQPQDLFIHGILDPDGKGGTCASMPVVYVAVGRRLGFPLYLVETRSHLFFRWDDSRGTQLQWRDPDLNLWIPPDRFNVEGACEGIAYYPDSHYIQWPELWAKIDFDHGRYLRSLTPKEELASFLIQRAECFYDLRKLDDALKAIYYARQLCPDDKRYQQLHAQRSKEWNDRREMHDHIVEMEQDRRRRQQLVDAAKGHSPHCCCGQCEQANQQAHARRFPSHGPDCQCRNCNQAREAAAAPSGIPGHLPQCLCSECQHLKLHPSHLPSHGPDCQCWNCNQVREAAKAPSGIPGHSPQCLCSGCQHLKLRQSQPVAPGSPRQMPNQIPNANLPHDPTFRHPHPRGLPGY